MLVSLIDLLRFSWRLLSSPSAFQGNFWRSITLQASVVAICHNLHSISKGSFGFILAKVIQILSFFIFFCFQISPHKCPRKALATIYNTGDIQYQIVSY